MGSRQDNPSSNSAQDDSLLKTLRMARVLRRWAGRLHRTDTRAGARAELVARYMADRAEHPAGSQLIVAYRNADARGLNDAVRDARHAAGELAHPAVPIGGRDYAAGDRIVFLSNDHQATRSPTSTAAPRPSGGVAIRALAGRQAKRL